MNFTKRPLSIKGSASIESLFATIFIVVAITLTSCADINEPLASADSAAQSIDYSLKNQGGDTSGDSKKISTLESFSYVADTNQSSIILSWQKEDGYTYTIVKASNPDCEPIEATQCIDFIKFEDVKPPFEDPYINSSSAGSVYYYWVLAQLTPISEVQASSAFASADRLDIIASDALTVALDFKSDFKNENLKETPDVKFLSNLSLLRTGKNTASITWRQNPELVVTVYGSVDDDCDVLNESADCAETLAFERSGSSPTINITSESNLDEYYFWVQAKRYVPLLNDFGKSRSRLYGPMNSSYLENKEGARQLALKLAETATFDKHSLSITFDAPINLVPQFSSYTFYIASGSKSVAKELTKNFAELESLETGTIPVSKLTDLSQYLSKEDTISFSTEEAKFGDLKQLSTGELFFELDHTLLKNRWYTVLLVARENGQLYQYPVSAYKSLQRLSVNVRGNNGIWRIRDKVSRAIHIAKKSSGFYYPSTSDWRNLMIDAELAFPDKQAYYFTGCSYYHDEPVLGGTPRLFNNQCHYAQLDSKSGQMKTVLENPLPVEIVFERKANAIACQKYEELPSHGYKRSRYYRLGAYEESICDNNIVTHNSNGYPNHFVMVYPNGEPTEIAHNQVAQWFAGTQVPIYTSGNAPLPAFPDGIGKATICSDLGEDKQCSFKEDIKVFRCNGYYSYELVKPTGCSVGYAWEEKSLVSSINRKNAAGKKSE